MGSRLLEGELHRSCDEPCKKLSQILKQYTYSSQPTKTKKVRGNPAAFMTKDLSKALMNKTKAKKVFKVAIKGKLYFL